MIKLNNLSKKSQHKIKKKLLHRLPHVRISLDNKFHIKKKKKKNENNNKKNTLNLWTVFAAS